MKTSEEIKYLLKKGIEISEKNGRFYIDEKNLLKIYSLLEKDIKELAEDIASLKNKLNTF